MLLQMVANGCKWLQMKFYLQRVIVCIIRFYMCVADVADKTSNFVSGQTKVIKKESAQY